MNKFNTKLSAAIAMAAVIATTLAPVAMADTTVVESGNGVNSTNNVTVNNTDNTTVNQSNATLIVNGVNATSNTGGNNANGNTGGNTTVDSGKATTKVNIENTGSSNDANLPDCGCPDPNTTVEVKNNGVNSDNDVKVTNSSKLNVNQENRSAIINLVRAKSRTGGNDASLNTGGNTTVNTGNAKTKVKIKNTGSKNILH